MSGNKSNKSNANKRKKIHRNQNTEIRHNTNTNNNIKTPRIISVSEFTAHHIEELQHIKKVLISNQPPPCGRPNLLPNNGIGFIDNKGRRQFQTLPRHLRRRSASHNLYRIPFRLRERARIEVLKSEQGSKNKNKIDNKTKPHRRHKRRPKYLRTDYLRRQQSTNIRWLETHIWSRKRMHLEPHWGYYLPMRISDKGIRASYKNSSYLSTIYDCSYLECIEMKGKLYDFHLLFSIISPLINFNNYVNMDKEYTCFIYQPNEYPKGLIGPVKFLWQKTLENNNNNDNNDNNIYSILFSIHPSIYNTIYNIFNNIIQEHKYSLNICEKKDDYIRYELTGPRSHSILQSILHLNSKYKYNNKSHILWNKLQKLRSCAELSSNCIISLNVDDPIIHFPPPAAKKIISEKESLNFKDTKDLCDLLLHWPDNTSNSNLWDFQSNINDSSLDFIPIILIQRPGGDKEYSLHLDKVILNNNQIGSGYDILIPKHCGMKFWKSIVFAGARVIGLNSKKAMNLEYGKLTFPSDYIDTNAGIELFKHNTNEFKIQYEKKPPSKRVNYIKLNSLYPWKICFEKLVLHWKNNSLLDSYSKLLPLNNNIQKQIDNHMDISNNNILPYYIIKENYKIIGDWLYSDDISQIPIHVILYGLVYVRITMIRRGTPKDNSFICFPSIKDCSILLNNNKNNLLSQELEIENINSKVSSRPNINQEFTFNTSRDILGYITSGGHTYSTGSGKGLGVCSFLGLYLLRRFYDLNDKDFGLVLIRNISSRNYFPAKITLPYTLK